jgi:hypothetical protein
MPARRERRGDVLATPGWRPAFMPAPGDTIVVDGPEHILLTTEDADGIPF